MTKFSTQTKKPSNWQPLRILTANVGNINLACSGQYNYKLCEKKVEKNITNSIQSLQPDVVFLQELLHPSQCDNWIETDENKVCFRNDDQPEPNQARRLLGSSYTILCGSRMRPTIGHPVGMECIGVRSEIGTIEGCQPNELCYSSEGLDFPVEECNPEFIIMSATTKIKNIGIKLINAHPHSRESLCRDNSLKQMFEHISNSSETTTNAIIAGDFNFDPFRSPEKTPDIWKENVGEHESGKPFFYHSGLIEHSPPHPTAYFFFQKKTIDHVISNFAHGVCTTLGEAPGTDRIDGGKGMDHRAILCDMWIPSQ